jgi:hypothetical protein
VFIAGPVCVVNGKSGYRVLWTERKRRKDRSVPELRTAREISMEKVARLLADGSGSVHPDPSSR